MMHSVRSFLSAMQSFVMFSAIASAAATTTNHDFRLLSGTPAWVTPLAVPAGRHSPRAATRGRPGAPYFAAPPVVIRLSPYSFSPGRRPSILRILRPRRVRRVFFCSAICAVILQIWIVL